MKLSTASAGLLVFLTALALANPVPNTLAFRTTLDTVNSKSVTPKPADTRGMATGSTWSSRNEATSPTIDLPYHIISHPYTHHTPPKSITTTEYDETGYAKGTRGWTHPTYPPTLDPVPGLMPHSQSMTRLPHTTLKSITTTEYDETGYAKGTRGWTHPTYPPTMDPVPTLMPHPHTTTL